MSNQHENIIVELLGKQTNFSQKIKMADTNTTVPIVVMLLDDKLN